MTNWLKLTIIALLSLGALPAYGQGGDLQIGGRITDSSGNPATGPVDLVFKFYDQSTGGNQLGGSISKSSVPLAQGVFQTGIDLSESEKTVIFGTGNPAYLEVTDATNGRKFPRQLFGSVPYAMRIPVDEKTLSFDGSGKLTIGSGNRNPGDVLKVDGSGNLSWGQAAGGIDPSGGSMSGDLDMGGTNSVTNIADPTNPQDAATKNYVDTVTLKLGSLTTAEETALIATPLVAGDAGKSWYNTDTNKMMYWNGTTAVELGVAAAGLSDFNGMVGSTQTLGTPGTTGIAPNWVSGSNIHTLNIPNANGAGVTGGLISKTEFDTFDGKQDAITTGAATEYLKGDLSLGTFATDVAATAAVTANTSGVASNNTAIGTNTTNIASNDTNIANNASNISSNDTDIATNASNIASNDTDIAANSTAIGTNATNISSNDTDIATNATNIASNDTDIATNATNIASNDTDIATNASAIATNTTAIGTKAADADVLKKDGSVALTSNWGLGGYDLTGAGNLLVSDDKSVGLGKVNTADEATFTTGWDNTQEGYTWFDPDTNSVKYWDGSAIQSLGVSGAGLTSLGGQSGGSQTFGAGAAGTTHAITSAGDVHTLNIPLASGAGVTSGTISKAEYDSFAAKQAPITTGAASEYLKGDLSLGTFATDVAATAAVSANTSGVAANNTAIGTNTTNISSNDTDIATNASAIATNATNISSNDTDIATNATNIASNDTDIATNASNISSNDTDIATNASNIASNDTDIATNASNIASNDTDIATNASDISSNYTDIATNTSNISSNATAIGTKAADSVVLKKDGSVALTSNWGLGGYDLTGAGNLLVSDDKSVGLGKVNTADETTFTTGWDNTQEGYTWFDPDTNSVKYWDGSTIQALGVSGAGLTSLGGQSGGSQTFAAGAAGTTHAISSAGDVHTLNIPLASGAGVTSGTISKTDYDSFAAKQAPITTGAASEYLKGDLSLGTFATDVAATAAVTANTSGVAANNTAIGTNTTNISSNDTDIATNASAIATNATNISSNDTDIATNATNIASNDTDIATNASNISSNDTDIATNASNIASNDTDIATNASNIASNDTDIATNASDISSNYTDIATNTSNISSNATAIGTKAADSVVLKKNGSVALTAAWDVGGTNTITNLPTPSANSDAATKSYVDGSVVSGFGASSTIGTLDWDDSTNARPGSGYSLLTGSATNGPGGAAYFHPFSFEYNTKDGTGNMTQFAVPYGNQAAIDSGMYFRGRYGGSWTNWAKMITANSSGNVGIGTTAPNSGTRVTVAHPTDARLDVVGLDGDATVRLVSNNANYASIDSMDVTYATPKNLAIQPNGGNVGIGTTSPKTTLQVYSGTDSTLADGTGYLLVGNEGATNLLIDNNEIMARNNASESSLYLQAYGGDLIVHNSQAGTEFVVKDSGAVGIGTSGPLAKLEVDGDIVSQPHDAAAATTIDWSNGNVQYSTGEGAFTLNNLRDGGSYTLKVTTDASPIMNTFTATGLTFKFQPANAAPTASSDTIYTMIRMGSDVYVSWISGF